MCREMLEAERKWLPQFDGKEIRPTPTICIPPDCEPAAVPLDPALAINRRFATLIEQKTE
jgi:alpha-galactosidase